MATISAGDALARLASDHPHQEIIRYEHKNVKWTLKHVNYYSDALACGLVDAGLQPGDVVLSWLPLHFAEQVSIYSLIMDLLGRLGRSKILVAAHGGFGHVGIYLMLRYHTKWGFAVADYYFVSTTKTSIFSSSVLIPHMPQLLFAHN